ncbi:MAG: CD225/dispanin family protein [Actinomycetota bacterium]|nr:CD225/dispanin family protein [Actinomycetota bacterium]
MSNPDEQFDGQNSQFGGQPPSGPTGNIPPHAAPPPYGQQPTPPYGQQPEPYGQQPGAYGQAGPYGQSSPYGQTGQFGQPPTYGQPAPWGQPMGPPPPNYLVYAILTTLFCCMPLGIVSIVFAAQVGSKWAMGDYAGAHHASNQAKTFARWSAISTGIFLGLYLLLVLVGGGLGMLEG